MNERIERILRPLQLRRVNPQYFRLPLMREPAYQDIPGFERPIDARLAGDDIWVTKDDYDRFVDAVVGFWEWLAAELEAGLRGLHN